MRKTLAALVVATVVPAGILLPTVTPVWAKPRPVHPHITTRTLAGVDAASLRTLRAATAQRAAGPAAAGAVAAATAAPAVLTPAMDTGGFQLSAELFAPDLPAGGVAAHRPARAVTGRVERGAACAPDKHPGGRTHRTGNEHRLPDRA